jgi:hypothetical protein
MRSVFGRAPKSAADGHHSLVAYFHPLDAIRGWNRLYGPGGLFQHQSVYPSETARETTIRAD